MPRAIERAAIAVAVAATAAAGCGGGDSGGDTTSAGGAALTKEEWITKADAICAPGQQKVSQAVNDLYSGPTPSQADLDHYAKDVLAATVQGDIDKIRQLPVPQGNEEQVDRILQAAQDGVDQLEAEGLDRSGGGPFIEANLLAQHYGLRTCGWV
jgi:hypothetical protein